MADGDPNDNQPDSTALDFSDANTDGGNKNLSLATQLTIPTIADGKPNDQRRDSTGLDFSESGTRGGDKCDNIDNLITTGNSNSSVAGGLYSLISSVMTGLDSRAEATARSHDQLACAVDRLTGELDKLLEDAPSPFIMQHAARISGLRKRVKALNTVLKSIQRQTDNMDRMLSAGSVHETLVGESSGQQPAL
ncbi:hypothetical protein PHJA_002896400 [Phtheirospermum japonicum]|uniref:Biogenesis of lysosome-related organelles complex 1 subunit 7 n=1 Tax=Phtheirospermum japonicum TaxID=374723 RepID=A0A830D9W8_9LAMI|nr:hypothetical protein PHJA_002896400 [Phtheirospermum japonicum]